MRPNTPRVTARRLGLDAAMILVLAGTSQFWGADVFLYSEGRDKLVHEFGTDAWLWHVLLWWLMAASAAVAIVLRHWWPLAATLTAAGSTTGRLIDGLLPLLPIDIAVLISLYTLAGTVQSRRTSIAVLAATETTLYAIHLTWALNVAARVASAAENTWRNDPVLAAAQRAALPGLLLVATWAVADSARTPRAYLATLQARADDLEREQEHRTALAGRHRAHDPAPSHLS